MVEYSKWVAGRLAASEIETVQPILIAFDFSERGIMFVKYRVADKDIKFEVVGFRSDTKQ